MANGQKRRLGRGLSSLMEGGVPAQGAGGAGEKSQWQPYTSNNDQQGVDPEGSGRSVRSLVIEEVAASPHQPRATMDEGALKELADSIRSTGVLQPIAVRPNPDTSVGGYELIAGERRLRAAKLAGLDRVPAIVHADLSDQQAAELALVENIQREELAVTDRAAALKRLCERFGLTHAQAAERVGIDRSTVTNLIRITSLDEQTLSKLRDGALSMGHAKLLLSVQSEERRGALAEKCVAGGWTVRRLERLVNEENGSKFRENGPSSGRETGQTPDHGLSDIEKQVSRQLGTRVTLRANKGKTKGSISIAFYSVEHFESLLDRMGVRLER